MKLPDNREFKVCEYLGDEGWFLDMTPYKVSNFRKHALRPFLCKVSSRLLLQNFVTGLEIHRVSHAKKKFLPLVKLESGEDYVILKYDTL
jgi:hypothetical protein